ncbi:TPA: hypothetical protein DDW35_11025 [Candidatus Sumerlaeota bacterium]|nr:hypothetical protein [Candidatus Sumerlaeota bacterium]
MSRFFLLALLFLLSVFPVVAGDVAPKTVSLDTSETQKLNMFFTDFSAVSLKAFEAGKLTDKALIEFAIKHCDLNHPEFLENESQLNAKHVDAVCKEHFGVAPKKHQALPDQNPYANGKYTVYPSPCDEFVFSQIASLTDNGDATYTAKVNVYLAPPDFMGDVHAMPKVWKAAKQDVKLNAKMTAVIKKENGNGSSHYVLLSLKEVK